MVNEGVVQFFVACHSSFALVGEEFWWICRLINGFQPLYWLDMSYGSTLRYQVVVSKPGSVYTCRTREITQKTCFIPPSKFQLHDGAVVFCILKLIDACAESSSKQFHNSTRDVSLIITRPPVSVIFTSDLILILHHLATP
jgi:hypothetical protein